DLLADTLGVIFYQDQVLEVAITLGGLTAGQADQFRRAMSRRPSHAAMERFREVFLAGARERGVDEATAQSILEKLLAFSELGVTTVHGLGADLARAIVAERDASGPYRSLPDLLRRTGIPRWVAERLIAVGALGEFGMGRRELLWQLGLMLPESVGVATRRPA